MIVQFNIIIFININNHLPIEKKKQKNHHQSCYTIWKTAHTSVKGEIVKWSTSQDWKFCKIINLYMTTEWIKSVGANSDLWYP